MTGSFSTNNSILNPFFDEINKYVDGVHKLNDGAEKYDIELLEKLLNIKLPRIYKDFLQVCNGGEIFAIPSGTVLSQVYNSNAPLEKGIPYLNDSFKTERRWPEMPFNFLIIADTNYGDTICIDLSTSDGYDANVVKWDHEEGQVSNRWGRLIDWLMYELEIGAMLVNYDGSEK